MKPELPEVEPWELVTMDPPTEAQAQALADFMRSQHDPPEAYPREKNQTFHWKLRLNTEHSGFASTMMTVNTRQVVSLCTVTPKRLWAWGTEHRWAEIGDTFTLERYQRRGMFSALVNASRERAQRAGYSMVFGLPNENSAPGYTGRLNFPIKKETGHVNCVLPTSTRMLASRYLGPYADRAWKPFAEGVLRHPAAALASRALASLLTTRPSPEGVTVREEHGFGDEYDGLWRDVREAVPIAQVRDARYLRWRFNASPFPFRLHVARRGEALVGYLVSLIQRDDRELDLRRLFLADWWFHPRDAADVGGALLQHALGRVTDEGVDVVNAQAVLGSAVQLPWKRFGFAQRPWSKPVIIHRNDDGARLLDDPTPWHFTLGDTDAF